MTYIICSEHPEIMSYNKFAPCPVCLAEGRIRELEAELLAIAEIAHVTSTGPAVPDRYWEIRGIAYAVLEDKP